MSKQKSKKCLVSDQNKKEIFYNLVNSGMAGGLVFLGACTNGGISREGIVAGIIASLIVAITQFKNYWDSEKKEYSSVKLFAFVR
jgi:hypothetical protein